MGWLAYEVATLLNQWAQLLVNGQQYAAMDFETFKHLNIAAHHFDNKAWRHEIKDAEPTTTPVQRVNPPTKAVAPPLPAGGYKRRRNATPSNRPPGTKRQKPQQCQPAALAPAPPARPPLQRAKGVAKPVAHGQSACLRHFLDPAHMQKSSRPKTRRMCSRHSPT